MKKIVTLRLPENEAYSFAEFVLNNSDRNQYWVICSWSKEGFLIGETTVIVILSVSTDEDFALLVSKFGRYIKTKKDL